MDIPQSEEEARSHIAQIRAAKNLDIPNGDFSDLENALDILSDQLYQKSAHFLLELIQNADDNTYPEAASPTLDITLSGRSLRIDCNEIGFSRRNAEAICKIGNSTKKGLNKSSRYIGEKGIGFKSVFKIADVVWIQSGHYSFKFDRHTRCGMIAPIWTPFPYEPRTGYTSMCLQLSDDCDTMELLMELFFLDSRLIMFLRKLRELNINVDEGPKKLSREEHTTPEGEGLITLKEQSNGSRTYKITHHLATNLPFDSKRPDCNQSEITLAFPLSDTNEPQLESQNVYAFLPIRDYGFKFLIQADFLLIASREDILASSPWNRALLESIPDAFRRAVDDFNSGHLKYSWIGFLKKRSPFVDFFSSLEDSIVRALANSPVIESQAGELTVPSKLKMLNFNTFGHFGEHFDPASIAESKYVSSKYSYSTYHGELARLGVEEIAPREFIQDLGKFIESSPQVFQNMPDIWHSDLSKMIHHLMTAEPALRTLVTELKIVPLKSGEWVSASQQSLHFADVTYDSAKVLKVPNGIPLPEIDPQAASKDARRTLFTSMGALPWTNNNVCEIITTIHSSSSFLPQTLTRQDLVSHLMFLFCSGWTDSSRWSDAKPTTLWMATRSSSVTKSDEIYMLSDTAGTASTCLEQFQDRFTFLHEDYMKLVPQERQSQLQEWMEENLGVAEYPRIVGRTPFDVGLNKDFQFLLDNSDYLSILLLLVDHWNFYATSIVQDPNLPDRQNRKQIVREAIGNMSVACRGGVSASLKDTMLPTHEVVAAKMTSTLSEGSLLFIDLPYPEDPKWNILSHFGVVVNIGIDHFINHLTFLRTSGATLEATSELYMQIYHQCNFKPTIIDDCKKRFSTENLIFIPKPGNQNAWITLQDCVWKGPKCLMKTVCLANFYPQHHPFFCSILGLYVAGWRTLTNEASKIEAFDCIDYISEIFVTINDQLQGLEEQDHWSSLSMVNVLKTSKIFPIDEGRSHGTFDYLSTCQDDATWFIADRPHLKVAFQGLVPLLAFKEETMGKIGPLIGALDWNRRLLSRLAHGISQPDGDMRLNYRYTKSLCSKARYIVRLLSPDVEKRGDIILQLCNSKVYTVRKITLRWTVRMPDSGLEVIGRADSGRVKVTGVEKRLEILLHRIDSDYSRPPFELLEELTTFCQLKDASHITLLHWLMSETNISEIANVFERRGLQHDIPEANALQQLGELNPHFWNDPSRNSQDNLADMENEAVTLDAISAFMNRFNKMSQWDEVKSREWSKTNTDMVLSHLCRLENVDPYSLLPQVSSDPWLQRLQRGGGFRDDPTSISFVHTHGEGSSVSRPHRIFAATVEITKDRGIQIMTLPDTTADVGNDTISSGELYVSKMLEKELCGAYQPEVHWTSSRRGQFGLPPFQEDSFESSTFTIRDYAGSAAFTEMLARKSSFRPEKSNKFPVYHIEVATTEGDILSEFAIEPSQVHKAWICHGSQKGRSRDKEIFILIRISDVQENPHVALFVDPWKMHAQGNLQLKSSSRYLAKFERITDFIAMDSTLESITSREIRASKKRKRTTLQHENTSVDLNLAGPSQLSPNKAYRYVPLKLRQIRLLELLPGGEKDAINGIVHHVSLPKHAAYKAISYTWGPALKPYHVCTAEGNIPITASLHTALTRFRASKESVFVWADAICIDQTNAFEKASQIRMLPAIFESAETVLAWVGGDEDGSHQAMETLLQIRTKSASPDYWPEGLPAIPSDWQHPGLPPTNSEIWQSISALFEREWFHRAWIIQEIVRASEVRFVCGAWDIAWDDIFAAIELCINWSSTLGVTDARVRESLSTLKPAYVLGRTRIAFKTMKFSPRFSMLTLLEDFAHARSTKESDKFFALLGISFDTEDDAFNPDYMSSIETIARRYANKFVSRGDAMELLYRSGISNSYPFASWIPSWSSNEPCRTISTWRGARGTFQAGNISSKSIRLVPDASGDARNLEVTGLVVDRVTAIGGASTASSDIITVINSLSKLIDSLGDYCTGESKAELMLKIPIGNAMRPCADGIGSLQVAMPDDSEQADLHWSETGNRINSLEDMIEFFKESQDERNTTWKYWVTAAAFLKRLSNGRFFVTERGYIGVGPDELSFGDQVCVLAGGRVPFLLSREYSTYSLVGECYVHGIMYGESSSFTGLKLQQFVLD